MQGVFTLICAQWYLCKSYTFAIFVYNNSTFDGHRPFTHSTFKPQATLNNGSWLCFMNHLNHQHLKIPFCKIHSHVLCNFNCILNLQYVSVNGFSITCNFFPYYTNASPSPSTTFVLHAFISRLHNYIQMNPQQCNKHTSHLACNLDFEATSNSFHFKCNLALAQFPRFQSFPFHVCLICRIFSALSTS